MQTGSSAAVDLGGVLGPDVCRLLEAGNRRGAIALVEADNDPVRLAALAMLFRAQVYVAANAQPWLRAALAKVLDVDAHRATVVARRRICPTDAVRLDAAVRSVAELRASQHGRATMLERIDA